MKVLFVTNHFLDGNGGGCLASRAYINVFGEIADECMLLYPENGKNIDEFISPKVIRKAISGRISNIGKLIDIYRGRINRYNKTLFEVIKSFHPHIVVFDNSRASAGFINKVKSLGIKIITIHHNYEMEYYASTKPSLLWRHAFMYYMRKAEKVAVKQSDLNLTLTNQDIELLRQHYDGQEKAIFKCLGVFEYKKTEYIPEKELIDKSDKQLTFVITGSLNDLQTEISLIPFLQEYYPLLLKQYPSSRLIVAGKEPSLKIRELCAQYHSIELVANPSDTSDIIRNADIYICPTSVGGGLKLRIMDGLKQGLPVLAHEVSARGYDDFMNAGYLLAFNDITTFEKHLNSIVQQIKLKPAIQKLYQVRFSFEKGQERLIKILDKHQFATNINNNN